MDGAVPSTVQDRRTLLLPDDDTPDLRVEPCGERRRILERRRWRGRNRFADHVAQSPAESEKRAAGSPVTWIGSTRTLSAV
ncbi:MAG: hypothetical protein ACREL7_02745 [Longimicrobiales bacterium]